MTRLAELYEMRRRIDAAIADEEAALERMRELRADTAAVLPTDTAELNRRMFDASARHFGVDPYDVGVGRRDKAVKDARWVYIWLRYRYCGATYKVIADDLGMDHTSIGYAVKKVDGDPRLKEAAAAIYLDATGSDAQRAA